MTDVRLTSGQVLARVRSHSGELGASEQRVLDTVIARPEEIVRLSVTELSGEVGVSASTVVRACQALGYRGFHELKVLVTQDLGRIGLDDDKQILTAESRPASILEALSRQAQSALADVNSLVTDDQLTTAITALANANRILAVAFGLSSASAHDFTYRLVSIGRPAFTHQDPLLTHTAASALTKDDVCFAISHTGATQETILACAAARESGAQVITVTSFARSPLTDMADVVLVAGGPDGFHNMQTISSRITHLTVLDALCIGVSFRTPEATQDAVARTTKVAGTHHW